MTIFTKGSIWGIWLGSKYTSQKQPPEVFCKKGVPINFAKITGKHLCQSLFFNEVGGVWPAALFKKRLWHRCFPVDFEKFLRTPFLKSTSGRLLLTSLFWKYLKKERFCNYNLTRSLPKLKILSLQKLLLKLLVAILEPSQTSKMELFVKILNGIKLLTIFTKKLHLRYLNGY